MAKTYLVEFSVVLNASREFEASDAEMARRIAEELLDNDSYREDIIASLDDPFSGWGDIEASVLCSYEDGTPSLDKEEYAELYGYEYPEE